MKSEIQQLSFTQENMETNNKPVICLGLTFENEDARREYFIKELRKMLPDLKKIEGFPDGEDETILDLSDPPYFTACPNPWMEEIISEWNSEKKDFEDHIRSPFVTDVSEGKTDTIYKAHGYHTKVPYKAIMRYLLHYTNPGDIVFFLSYEREEKVPDQIASYLRRNYHELRGLENTDVKLKAKAVHRWYVPDTNKQADLDKLREKTLLREFDYYVEELGTHMKKLKQFRTEAIRSGFKKAWSEKNYEKIVSVGNRLPESVIQEDDKLLMFYDNAQVRLGL